MKDLLTGARWGALIAIVLCCGYVFTSNGSIAIAAPDVSRATVAISSQVALNGRTQYAIGAGVIVGEDAHSLTILTAAHLAHNKNLRIQTSDGAVYTIASIATIAGHDLAIVRTRQAPKRSYRVARIGGLVSDNQDLTVIGTPYGVGWTMTSATRSHFNSPKGDTATLTINCPNCSQGDGGGGVFDFNGKLVGIIVGAYEDQTGAVAVTIAEPIEAALSSLRTTTLRK